MGEPPTTPNASQGKGAALARERIADDGHSVTALLRFVDDAKGLPMPGVRLLTDTGARTLDPEEVPLAVADEDGVIRWCEPLDGKQWVAVTATTLPLSIRAADAAPSKTFHLQLARTLVVHCVDDHGAPLPGCLVQLTTTSVAETLDLATTAYGLANPRLQTGAHLVRSDARGIASFGALPLGQLWLRAQHPRFFAIARDGESHRPLASEVKSLVIQFVHALGLLATLPEGTTPESWDFVVEPPGIDRALYGYARAMEKHLRGVFPGCGVFVLARSTAADAPEARVRAIATDGSLWMADAALVPLDQFGVPLLLRPPVGASGWARVDLRSGLAAIDGFDLFLVDSESRMWRTVSGRSTQLPCGRYEIVPMQLCPGIDEQFLRRSLLVVPSVQASLNTVEIDLGMDIGWVTIDAVSNDGTRLPSPSVTVELASGSGFTLPDIVGSPRLALPVGTHTIQVHHADYAPWNTSVQIRRGELSTVKAKLRSETR